MNSYWIVWMGSKRITALSRDPVEACCLVLRHCATEEQVTGADDPAGLGGVSVRVEAWTARTKPGDTIPPWPGSLHSYERVGDKWEWIPFKQS